MRFSKLFLPTRKEDPAEAEVVSHKLLIRAGYIRMIARGIYDFLPVGWRSVRKIEQIIREEMDLAGAQEVRLPAVQPAELWQESGRWSEYGAELLRIKDRKGGDFCLGPTHEEVITDLVRGEVKSYKQLPINLYQIQTKFRDEPRPRFGLMRGREFIMKDAYSFDTDEQAALQSYDVMFETYNRICRRLGFEYRAVEADTGNIGGSRSHEFQVLAETGEDEIVSCSQCSYAANVEKAEIRVESSARADDAELKALTQLATPGQRTIEEVSKFLKQKPAKLVKTLIYLADETPIAVLVRGDHQANELKIKAYLNAHTEISCRELNLAADVEVERVTNAALGFAGPVGLQIPIFADLAVEGLANFIVGANAVDAHFVNTNHGRDFEVRAFADLRQARGGDLCARCGGSFESHRGIEVGHVFFLGDKYSKAMNATFADEAGHEHAMQMGCYGIGVTRILAAVVEQNHDENGIIWPMAISPYHVTILPLQNQDEEVVALAERLYAELMAAGVEVLLDDRDMRAGFKFKDADLVGIPLRINIGSRGVKDGQVELKLRRESDHRLVGIDEIVAEVTQIVRTSLATAKEAALS
ncbi:MAG: proline--tRNA ligase [Bradymonadaceae bacterium]|nr:proline--tRNA ligase [Lujinxingiaceae bacterium]